MARQQRSFQSFGCFVLLAGCSIFFIWNPYKDIPSEDSTALPAAVVIEPLLPQRPIPRGGNRAAAIVEKEDNTKGDTDDATAEESATPPPPPPPPPPIDPDSYPAVPVFGKREKTTKSPKAVAEVDNKDAEAEQSPSAEGVDEEEKPQPSPQTQKLPSAESVGDLTVSQAGLMSQGKCMGPFVPPKLSSSQEKALRSKINEVTESWGYFQLSGNYKPFKGLRVLDIGMGQGPMGVVAMHAGVKGYVGLDPALCINQKAKTRDKSKGRLPNPVECEMIMNSEACKGQGKSCQKFISCENKAAKKYRIFPITGIDIMQGFPGKILLLPGTFETVKPTGLIERGSFDVATLWLVTEHLPNNRLVIEGVFNWTLPGQMLALKHHNYYGYDGHHNMPDSPDKYDPKNAAQKGVVNWKHLERDSWVYAGENLNRVRIGDLIAMIDVYFDCSWTGQFPEKWRPALKPDILRKFEKRGFSKVELLLNKWLATCVRRDKALAASWLDSRIWFHPPTDGSYTPRPLPKGLEPKGASATYSSPGHPELKEYLRGGSPHLKKKKSKH
eukprot:TRINITY_DN8989_c0_g1_i2.p1 TRINITY_DN8989_c0_g1~~TRINITY_DN8989_c0_g1_i2.p1  ORF type:complete len:555 (+),score=118.03 TRINITY_DN8989_c0_g1_i2:57-1721(+)